MGVNVLETKMDTLLNEAKAWFAEAYAGADLDAADYDSEELPWLARLSVCADPLPEGFPTMTYAEAVAKIVGEFTYAQEISDADEYEGCEIDEDASDCSRCGRTNMTVVAYTQNRALAAKYKLDYVLAGVEVLFNRDRDGFSFEVAHAEAAYDEGEELSDAGVDEYIDAQEKARAATAAADEVARQAQRDAMVSRLRESIPTLHPLVQAQAQGLIQAIEADRAHTVVSYVLDQRFKAIGCVSGVANGESYRVSDDPNIGGRRVDHLREGGLVGMTERRDWDAVAQKHFTTRVFYRPTEVYDILQRAEAAAERFTAVAREHGQIVGRL